jgi:hypothetical protein
MGGLAQQIGKLKDLDGEKRLPGSVAGEIVFGTSANSI